jgi:hypothetical protein
MNTRAESTTAAKGHVGPAIGVVDTGLGTKLVEQEAIGPEVIGALVDLRVMEHSPVVDENR